MQKGGKTKQRFFAQSFNLVFFNFTVILINNKELLKIFIFNVSTSKHSQLIISDLSEGFKFSGTFPHFLVKKVQYFNHMKDMYGELHLIWCDTVLRSS